MKYYRFKTFTTSYYFPQLPPAQGYMYGLYSAYGGKLSKLYWWLFRHCGVVRGLTSVDDMRLDFPYKEIKAADGGETLMAFNMGSPGVEQKISILGYDQDREMPFFAKFSQKPRACELTRNEIRVYKLLEGTGLTPYLLKAVDGEEYVYMKAEYIKGSRPKVRTLTDEIVNLSLSLSKHHLTELQTDDEGLRMSLSHGDFCPWNVLVSDGDVRLIDWELAADRPLGYDLLTYICQVSILFEPEKPLISVIDENMGYVTKYFSACGISDCRPYINAFARMKWEYEKSKGNSLLTEKYKELMR